MSDTGGRQEDSWPLADTAPYRCVCGAEVTTATCGLCGWSPNALGQSGVMQHRKYPEAGAGSAFNLYYCLLGDLRLLHEAHSSWDYEAVERLLSVARDTFRCYADALTLERDAGLVDA